jgi:sugar lactone lactonase YvrE
VFLVAASLLGCAEPEPAGDGTSEALSVVAAFDTTQITGVAVSGDGRVFVNSPFWTDTHDISVWEVTGRRSAEPYPNAEWNRRWDGTGDPAESFVCVQSVYIDPENPQTLWVLDPASPRFAGVVEGGAKLVKIDLTTDTVARTIAFDASVAPEGSYLNDVRVTADQSHAFITDSNLGALLVVDLEDGATRRVLDDHPSTAADSAYTVRVGGQAWTGANGETPQIASDGIALAPDDRYVYYHALTGTHLYRIPTAALTDPSLSADALADQVDDLGATVVTDGMIAAGDGTIYHTALEADAVIGWHPERGLDTLVVDRRLKWPDSFAIGPGDSLYVTTSQIHLMPQYNRNSDRRTDPYRVFRHPLSGGSE